jgi:hypothetical protein
VLLACYYLTLWVYSIGNYDTAQSILFGKALAGLFLGLLLLHLCYLYLRVCCDLYERAYLPFIRSEWFQESFPETYRDLNGIKDRRVSEAKRKEIRQALTRQPE